MRAKKASNARGDAFGLDHRIDKVLGSIFDRLKGNLEVLEPNDPAVASSELIIAQAFPDGVKPITTLPFEEQLAHNTAIAERFEGDLKQDVIEADIGRFAKRLSSLNAAFRSELDKPETKEIDFGALEAAREQGNLNIRTLVAVILSEYRDKAGEAAENGEAAEVGEADKVGEALLKPILDQCERIRQARKGRRPIQDVDPDTGEELPQESDEDAADQAQVAGI